MPSPVQVAITTAQLGERLQDEVFSGGDFRCASVAAPSVRATRQAGGYRLEGAVAYCSGIPYSTYFMGQAMLPESDEQGMPRLRLYVAPRSAFTVLDDWGDSLGLKGTGSDTIRFDGAVVARHAALEDVNMIDLRVEDGTPGVALHGNPMCGGRALVIFTLSLAARSSAAPTTRSTSTRTGPRLAAIARETMVQAWEAVEQHLLRTIGSSAIRSGQRFERLFRDLATMAAHRNTMLREEFWRQLGAIELGVSYPSPGGTWPPSPIPSPTPASEDGA